MRPDEKQLLSKLSEFVARKPERLPPFRADDLDLCMAVQRISAVKEKVSFVVGQCVQLSTMVGDMKLLIANNSLNTTVSTLCQQMSSAGVSVSTLGGLPGGVPGPSSNDAQP